MSSASPSSGPVVLVAPLDWGLGHATRCFPIIRKLMARGCRVHLGGSGASGRLLRAAFPALPYHEIPGHTVRYARSRRGWLWKIVQQLPRLRHSIRAEHQWLNTFLRRQPLQAVISDNRYGLYHSSLPCILITHQLEIRTPFGAPGNRLLRRLHYRLIARFRGCWVPDSEKHSLAGALSHPPVFPPVPTRYIGPLSRFSSFAETSSAPNYKPQTTNAGASAGIPTGLPRRDSKPQTAPWSLVVLLSGPEPQRSIWERQLLAQLAQVAGPVLLLRGLPGTDTPLAAPPQVTVHAHLPAGELEDALRGGTFVLARCGYSTVMDLAALGARGILVPTPGQTEQEYLARHVMQEGFALCYRQEGFDLHAALQAAQRFPYRFPPPGNGTALDAALDELEQWMEARKGQ